MESDGVLKTLAEPNLTAVSGQPAKFHAGGEVPATDLHRCWRDARLCDINYKDFGVSLDFTPVVLSEGRINLKIRSEVSEIGPRDRRKYKFRLRAALRPLSNCPAADQ